MRHTLEHAILDKKVISLDYEPGMRVIEPHALGFGSEGQILLRAYQTAGASASGEHENWKMFRLDRIQSATETGQSFDGPRTGYRRGDKAMKRGIIAEL